MNQLEESVTSHEKAQWVFRWDDGNPHTQQLLYNHKINRVAIMNVIGLDIGGANIKAADRDGHTLSQSFALWKGPQQLPEVLREVFSQLPSYEALAVTMTAELADCFETKAQGVDHILQSVEQVAGSRPVYVWQTGAEFVAPSVAREIPLLVAAANWHALATWVGRMIPEGAGLLLDIGTTTTDIIPILKGVPVPQGLTDRERLEQGELAYSGTRRTPLCAIAHTVPFRDQYCPLAAEFFATTLDVYLWLGDLPESPQDCNTANGKPATREAALDRLARMLCCDRTEFTPDDADNLARFLADVHQKRLAGLLEKVLSQLNQECRNVLISGSGSFLAQRLIDSTSRLQQAKIISLTDSLSPQIAESACAFAVARLAVERVPELS